MEQLYQDLKELIVDALMLTDLNSSDIATEDPLFAGGLGLDSIDAMELGLAVKHKYGVRLSSDCDVMRHAFYSVKNLGDFIAAQRPSPAAVPEQQ